MQFARVCSFAQRERRAPLRWAAVATVGALLGFGADSFGATKLWDTSDVGADNGVIDNGSGVWDTNTTANFTTDGGVTNVTWNDDDDAIFGGNPGVGAAGIVTLSGTINASSITFNPVASGNFVLAGGDVLNLTGGNIYANADARIESILGGSAGLTKHGSATLTLTGENTISGAVTINNGTLVLAGADGALNSATSYTLDAGATLRLDNSLAAGGNHSGGSRLAGAPVTLNGGTLVFINDGTATSETTGNLTAGLGASTISFSGAGASTLNFGSYSRSAGATLNFVGANSTHQATFTGLPTGFINQGTYVDGTSFAFYDAGGFVRAMNYTTDPNVATSLTAGRHVRLTATGSIGNNASLSILTLNLAGATVGLNIGNNSTLTISQGGIIKSGGGASTIAPGGNVNTNLTTGSTTEWVIRTDASTDQLTIAKRLGGGSGLTKTGAGILILNASNNYGGDTSVAEGTLRLGTSGGVPSTSNLIVDSSATFDLDGNNGTVANIALYDGLITGSGTLTMSGGGGMLSYLGGISGATISSTGLALGSSSGTANHDFTVLDGAAEFDLTISASISSGSGTRGINKLGLGTLRLTGNNSYSGATNVNAGVLSLSGSLASTTVSVSDGAILDVSGSLASGTNLALDGTASFSSASQTIATLSDGGAGARLLTLNGTQLTVTGASTFTGTIAGIGSLVKSGSGTFALTAAQTYTGATQITGGTLNVDSSLANSSLTVAGGTLAGAGTVNSNASISSGAINFSSSGNITGNLAATGGSWSGAGSVAGPVSLSSGTFTIGTGANLTASSGLSISGGTLAGAGTLTGNASIASGAISMSGNVTGTLAVTGGTWSGTGSVAGNTTVSSGTFNITGTLGGAGDLIVSDGAGLSGNGTVNKAVVLGGNNTLSGISSGLTLNSPLTYTGTSSIASGTVKTQGDTIEGSLAVGGTLGGTGTLAVTTTGTLSGTGAVQKNVTLADGGMINLSGGGNISGTLQASGGTWSGGGTVGGAVTVSSNTFTIGSAGHLTANAGVNVTGTGVLSAAAATTSKLTGNLNYTSSVSSTFVGQLTGGGDLTLNSPAVLTLSNSNNHSGVTNIRGGGQLSVMGSITGSGGDVNVGNGTADPGTLSGTGTVTRTVNVNAGGTLSPAGNAGVGKMTTGAQNWASGGTYVWNIVDAADIPGAGFDLLDVTGTLTINATAVSKFVVKVVSTAPVANFDKNADTSWVIAQATSITGYSADRFEVDVSDFVDDNAINPYGAFGVSFSSGTLSVTYMVPEPNSMLLVGATALGLLRRRRRQPLAPKR